MKVLLIDDEQPCLDELTYLLGKYSDVEIAATYTQPVEALEAVKKIKPDAVFLDIDMPKMNGLELALQIQVLYPGIIVIFVTAFSKYALDSFKAYPLDYLLKPIKEARLDAALEQMRKRYTLMHPDYSNDSDTLRITCFGRFKLNVKGLEDIKWGTKRVKQLFMYLIDKCGAAATREELIDTVFEGLDDKKTANNMYVTIYKLRSLLDIADKERKHICLKEDYSLEISPGICDYIDFMRFARQNAAITVKNAIEASKVLSLYTGMYLEDENCEWVAESSSIVEIEYERISIGLSEVHAGAGRFREAESILLDLLKKNPLSEDGYRALLDLYMKIKSEGQYISRYEDYTRMLRKEFGQKPLVKYDNYYEKLLAK